MGYSTQMRFVSPLDGDIGEPIKTVEIEPVEEPIPSTVPEEVPA